MHDNPYWIIALALIGATFFAWYNYIKLPRIILASISKVPNFDIQIFHPGKGIALAFDFSKRTFVYSDAGNTYLFHAYELMWCQPDCQRMFSENGTVIEQNHHLRIRLRNHNCTEIKAYFYTEHDAQLCENSFANLLLEEAAFRENISNQTITDSSHLTPKITEVERKSDSSPNNEELTEQLIELLENKGFSRNDGKRYVTRSEFNQATDMIFKTYKTSIGPKIKHNDQQAIEEALCPFFERRPNAPKKTGFTSGTIGKYLSENKTAWEERGPSNN